MHVLALDSTTRVGSAAIACGDRVLIARAGDPARTQAQRLPTELLDLLQATDLTLDTIDVFAIACGPGSFTGLRIGIATIQGLAFVTRRPVIALSALEALAQEGAARAAAGTYIAAWIDAYRGEVFSALYRVSEAPPYVADRLTELDAPAVGDPLMTIDRWRAAGFATDIVVGDGASTYRELIAGALPAARLCGEVSLLAATLALMAGHRARAGEAIDPGAIRPLYVRRPDAELARDRGGSAP